MAEHNDLGKQGEQFAVEYLLRNNYEVIQRNYRWKSIEVDIIALKNNILHFIEVKTRSSLYFGEPEVFVSKKQQKSYIQAADAFVVQNNRVEEVQFDIVAIIINKKESKISFIENAFSILG